MRAQKHKVIAKTGFEDDFVRACQQGSPDAYRELYEFYKRKVYSLAAYMTGDAELSKDLTQEIFMKVFRDIRAFRLESSFSSWLYRLATNACLNALRDRRTRREVDINQVKGTVVEIDPSDSPEQRHMSAQVRRRVLEAILSLKPPLRAVVVLRYIEDLSYAEIADALSCSEGTVASRLSRAHHVLERKLRAWEALIP